MILALLLPPSDDPKKCDHYWKKGNPRQVFACYVLLGDIKVREYGSLQQEGYIPKHCGL